VKMVTVEHNGFHGRYTVRFIPLSSIHWGREGTLCEVSARTARRLNGIVCGMATCQCGEAVADDRYLPPKPGWPFDSRRWAVMVPPDGREIRGHYPQQP